MFFFNEGFPNNGGLVLVAVAVHSAVPAGAEALVGAFSVIVQLHRLIGLQH